MKITQAEFVISAVLPHQYPEDALPEIALAGRSNVGKSSLINNLIMRKALARTSSQPGKTQQLNYYRVNDKVYFVDFPGYGYAKVSKTERQAWGVMIETYLKEREPLKMVLLIVDLRHPPSKDDQLMYGWLKHFNIPVTIVTTKADKLPRSKWDKHLKVVKQTLEADPRDKVIMYSSEKGIGREELWQVIEEKING
ncbi:ribosome biogenesis GTP-binding protein YihA/YsxC [Paenibacillus pinihumi]|uniref:ribosome biogenesis GTP-binding protein YihA/YsxC n=1 Tax=Paenibacillus pinihumi TaxID=669462 RepID=UPI00040AAD0E|nr:ribosome biogenesis GTP-binding protein YihA/YsxC [Paenibacillus pinihumi]